MSMHYICGGVVCENFPCYVMWLNFYLRECWNCQSILAMVVLITEVDWRCSNLLHTLLFMLDCLCYVLSLLAMEFSTAKLAHPSLNVIVIWGLISIEKGNDLFEYRFNWMGKLTCPPSLFIWSFFNAFIYTNWFLHIFELVLQKRLDQRMRLLVEDQGQVGESL